MNNFINNLLFDVKRLCSLEAFTSKEYGVSDLLLFSRFVSPGVIMLVDGSFTTSLKYRGKDLDAATDELINSLNQSINSALGYLGSGWTMHLDCLRYESAGYIDESKCYFNNATSSLIDIERRLAFSAEGNHYENEYVLSFTYLPPKDITSNMGKFFLNDTKDSKNAFDYNMYLDDFNDKVISVANVLLNAGFSVERMSDKQIFNYLFYCINGIKSNIDIPINHWTDLRYLLASQDIIAGFEPQIGSKYMRVISVSELPNESYPNLLNHLNSLNFEYRWSTRYIFLSNPEAKKMFNKLSNLHAQGRQSAISVIKSSTTGDVKINRSSDQFMNDAEEAIALIDTDGVQFGKYTGVIVLFDEDKELLNEKVKIVEATITSCNLIPKIESVQSLEAFLGSIPSMVRPNVRKHIIHSYNLSHLMPTTSIWSGYNSNPCKYYIEKDQDQVLFYAATTGATPFRGCLHVGDVGHTLIIGDNYAPIANFLATQQNRYANSKVFIFDSQYSNLALCYGVNGLHYDIGSDDSDIAFQPLAKLDQPSEFTFASNWLVEICEINGLALTPTQRAYINEVLELIKVSAIPTQRTMNYFQAQIRSKDPYLAEIFKSYTAGDNLQNKLFDSDNDQLHLSNFTVFELNKLIDKGPKLLIPAIKYLFHSIEQVLDGNPVSIYINDGFNILKHEVFTSFLDDWLRKIATKNVQFIISLTSPSDILGSNIANTLMQACPTKIFTPNYNAQTQQYNDYASIGLNSKQIKIITQATVNREYYFSNTNGNRLIDLNLGEVANIFLNPPSIEDIKILKNLKKEYKDKFGYHWIKEKLGDNPLNNKISETWLTLNKHLSTKV